MRALRSREVVPSLTQKQFSMAAKLIALAFVLFAWTHRNALSLVGFADDLGLLADLPRLAMTGELWADVASRFIGPLWQQSTMWRPVPYASFAFDAWAWRSSAGGWHLTNLLLHIANATVVGFLGRDLYCAANRAGATDKSPNDFRDSACASGALAFALFLLCPWAPEVTLWLVGRFDGWATLFVLLALWTGLHSDESTKSAIVSLLAAALAYASKESALILLPWLLVTGALVNIRSQTATATPARWRRWVLFVAAHLLLVVAYVAWRNHVFGSTAASVYGTSPASILQWLQQCAFLLGFPAGLASLATTAATLTTGTTALLLLYSWRDQATRRVRLIGFAMSVSVIAALALYLSGPPGSGEGYRLYYLAAAGLAIALGALPRRMTTALTVIIVLLVLALGQWQSRVAAEWAHASFDMRAVAKSIRTIAADLPRGDYALLLLPDQQGHVPFARNAQGGVLALAQRLPNADDAKPVDPLSHLIIFTPPQLNEWQRLARESVVHKLTPRADAPANPTRYFCFDARSGSARDLGYWPPAPPQEWSDKWRQAVARQCPVLPANWP